VTPLLLDTCAAIWLALNDSMSPTALRALDQSAAENVPVFVSPMTAWEIGLLNARGRLALSLTPQAWFSALLKVPGVALADLSADILIASSFLPGSPPRDPVDRIVTATAREKGLCLVTRDKAILNYAAQGHVDALAC
jgi:PIN domain nuclease of toxin-antitoxin system